MENRVLWLSNSSHRSTTSTRSVVLVHLQLMNDSCAHVTCIRDRSNFMIETDTMKWGNEFPSKESDWIVERSTCKISIIPSRGFRSCSAPPSILEVGFGRVFQFCRFCDPSYRVSRSIWNSKIFFILTHHLQ